MTKFENVNAKVIKEAFEEMEKWEVIADAAEKEYEKDCENPEKENTFDTAYSKEFNATSRLVHELVKLDPETTLNMWRKLLATKRNEVRELINKLVA